MQHRFAIRGTKKGNAIVILNAKLRKNIIFCKSIENPMSKV